MIIYNKVSLANLQVQQQAKDAYDLKFITELEQKNIKAQYPTGFYTPNPVVSIGFFILTMIGSMFAGGFLTLIFDELHVTKYAIWPAFLGLCTYAALEFIVKQRRIFRAGTDDALLLLTTSLLVGAFIFAVPNGENQNLFVSGFMVLTGIYFTLRFAHPLLSVATGLSFLALVFFSWSKAGAFAEATMPFVIMLASIFIYYTAKQAGKPERSIAYRSCLICLQVTSFITLYAAGNYFVVQKLSNLLHQLPSETNGPLPFAWFFLAWTIFLPFGYISLGIKNKSLLLLRTGLILVLAAVVTFRNYYDLLPTEYVVVIGGTIVLLVAISLLKYLKIPKNGFAYAKPGPKHWSNNIHLDSLIVAGITPIQSAPTPQTDHFGGGSFGGGGASSDY
jgi:hypothetical protein